jgi:hypothetical protein
VLTRRPRTIQSTNQARRGSKRRCVKREAHRPHTEALGSSAQIPAPKATGPSDAIRAPLTRGLFVPDVP